MSELMIQTLAPAGLPAVLMGVAIIWLKNSNAALVMEMNRERIERLDRMQEQITECERDRKELRDMLVKHLKDRDA